MSQNYLPVLYEQPGANAMGIRNGPMMRPLGDIIDDASGALQSIQSRVQDIAAIRENTDAIKEWMPWATMALAGIAIGLFWVAVKK